MSLALKPGEPRCVEPRVTLARIRTSIAACLDNVSCHSRVDRNNNMFHVHLFRNRRTTDLSSRAFIFIESQSLLCHVIREMPRRDCWYCSVNTNGDHEQPCPLHGISPRAASLGLVKL